MSGETNPAAPEAAPATPPSGTATTETPGTPEGTGAQTSDWEQRYKDVQSEYTRATQELARYKNDPEFQQQHFRDLASQLGYQIEDPEPAPVGDEPMTRAEFEAWQQQQAAAKQEQEQLAALNDHVETQIGQIEGLDKADRDWVISRAFGMDPVVVGTNHMPDIQGAYQALVARDTEAQKRWKTTKQAPHVPATGQTGTDTPNLDDMSPQDLEKWMVEQYAARSAD